MRIVQPSSAAVALCFLFALVIQSGAVLAQADMTPEEEAIYKNMIKSMGIDPDAQMEALAQGKNAAQWTDAKVIHYQIVGIYQGKPNISSDPGKGSGFADVTDRVEIDLDWELAESRLVGQPQIRNSKAVVKNPHDSEPSCHAPILKGDYEHYVLQGIKDGLGGGLELQVQTIYPEVDVAQFCTGGRKSIAAATRSRRDELVVPSPLMLGMPLPDSDNLSIASDKKSMIHKSGGWTWTFTPSNKRAN